MSVWRDTPGVLAWAAKYGDGAIPALVSLLARPKAHPLALAAAERVHATRALGRLLTSAVRAYRRAEARREADAVRLARVATAHDAGAFVSALGTNWTGD